MCGIVGAIAERDVQNTLLEGLKRLEYRGYDSAGIAVIDQGKLQCHKTTGKVAALLELLKTHPLTGHLGIAHTRWATHGTPSDANAHPHISHALIALVHNGIVENYHAIKEKLIKLGYELNSETDSENVVHLIHHYNQTLNFPDAVRAAVRELEGAFALAIIHRDYPDQLIAVRQGSPLVIGLGENENYIASDMIALLPVTQRFIILQEGDVAVVSLNKVEITDFKGQKVYREIHQSELRAMQVDRGNYRHFMLKEIYEQAEAIRETLEGRISKRGVLPEAFGTRAPEIFNAVKQIQIVACGTSYHAGLVARYWIESMTSVPCQVEIASEFRYRHHVVQPDTLFIAISQSGETADTLAALKLAEQLGYLATLGICNVPGSSLVRESDMILLTRAGMEIGVASTKAFTTQLIALLLLTVCLGRMQGRLSQDITEKYIRDMQRLPQYIERMYTMDNEIKHLSRFFADKQHVLYLGRGIHYPIAMEGALKLKELSYIHAEAYPAGELKHGPLALVDKNMPVVTVMPNDELLEKLKSNLEEVKTRGGELFVFADEESKIKPGDHIHIISMPHVPAEIAPIVYTIPLQLLAYHIAVLKGTDVDQPRNLAKSVTVE